MKNYGIGICPICEEIFVKTAPNKKFCSMKCNPWKNGSATVAEKSAAVPEKLNLFENELENEFVFLEQLKEIAVKVFRIMRVSRLDKFSNGVQEMGKELMIKTQKYLNSELNGSIKLNKKRVIDV